MNYLYGVIAALLLAVASFFYGDHVGSEVTTAHVDTAVINTEKKDQAAQTAAANDILSEIQPRNLYYKETLIHDEAQSKAVASVAAVNAPKTVGENAVSGAPACVAPDSQLLDINGALTNAAVPTGSNVVPSPHASK
jgi:hypothetical protein